MKKILASIVLFCATFSHAQYLTVTTPSNCLTDGSGAAISSGTMIIVGTDANDNTIPYRAGTAIMATTAPISRTITNGALATSLQLADPATTSPTNILYRFTIQDNASKRNTVYKQIVISNNDAGNFNFCKMNPLPFTTQVQFAAAPFSFSGDWALLGNLSVAKSTQLCASTVTFSATPTFNAGICNGWKITLTGNVTSSTLSGPSLGEPLFFEVCQDATGSRTFVPPTNVVQWTPINSAPNSCTLQVYWWDGTQAIPDIMPGLTGDATSGTGSTTTTVVKVNGVAYSAGPSTHSVPVVTGVNVVTYKVLTTCPDSAGNHINYDTSTDTWSCGTTIPSSVVTLTGSQSVTGQKSMTSPVFVGGVSSGTGLDRLRVASCTTSAISNGTCVGTVTWNVTFANTSYTALCIPDSGVAGNTFIVATLTKTTTTMQYILQNVPGNNAASTATVNCIAIHD